MSKSTDSTPNRTIRKASLPKDSEKLMEVFAAAKNIMAADGNYTKKTG